MKVQTPTRNSRKYLFYSDLAKSDNKKDIVPENSDKIGVFAVLGGDISRNKIADVKRAISLCGMV